ncbi:MAG: HEAT repeat domain-containing protein [Phycisphaeraceae bacterium]
MFHLQSIYRRLQSIRDASVDAALAAALPTADREAARLIALMLLTRADPHAREVLVTQFHRLPADVQRTLLEHAGELDTPLRLAMDRREPEARQRALEIIVRARQPRLAYLAVEPLTGRRDSLYDESADCLLRLAETAAVDPAERAAPAADAAAMAELTAAIQAAMQRYPRHRRDGTILAAMTLLPRPSVRLLRVLESEREAASAARRLLEEAEAPAARRALLPMLAHKPFRDAAKAGLARAVERGRLGEVLDWAHLAVLPGVGQELKKLDNAWRLLPGPGAVKQFLPHQARQLPRWLAALPLERQTLVEQLAALSRSGDAMVRLSVLRRLLELAAGQPGGFVDEIICGFTSDADPAIARLALRHLIRRGDRDLLRHLVALLRSEHAEVRRLAEQQLGTIGFARLWAAWPRLEPARRSAAGRTLMKLDSQFNRQLGEKLYGDRAARMRALAMVGELRQAGQFEAALIRLAGGEDEKVASAAVKVLGELSTPGAQAALEAALRHADSRVRANAVEALDRQESARHMSRLLEMAEGDDNRPRANAIGALLKMSTKMALPALTQMLEDDRPRHRISALWLVEELGLMEVVRAVAEIASGDVDPGIRQRAERVVGVLEETLAHAAPASGASGPAGRGGATGLAPRAAGLASVGANLVLLATMDERVQAIRRNWDSGELMQLDRLLPAVGGLLVGIGGLALWRWWRQPGPRPGRVFREVASSAGLGWRQRRLLVRIAREQGLPTPLTLMLSSRTLSVHARAYVARRPDGLAKREALRQVALVRLALSHPID